MVGWPDGAGWPLQQNQNAEILTSVCAQALGDPAQLDSQWHGKNSGDAHLHRKWVPQTSWMSFALSDKIGNWNRMEPLRVSDSTCWINLDCKFKKTCVSSLWFSLDVAEASSWPQSSGLSRRWYALNWPLICTYHIISSCVDLCQKRHDIQTLRKGPVAPVAHAHRLSQVLQVVWRHRPRPGNVVQSRDSVRLWWYVKSIFEHREDRFLYGHDIAPALSCHRPCSRHSASEAKLHSGKAGVPFSSTSASAR